MERKSVRNRKGYGEKRHSFSRIIMSYLLVAVMVSSVMLPGSQMGLQVQAKERQAVTLIIGGSNRSMIAKSKHGVIYTYRSSNEKVASVSKNGVISGKKRGKASIIRYVTQNHKTKIDKVQVFQVKPFAISGKKTVYVNGKYRYKTNGSRVCWTLNSKNYASVSSKGVLKPKKAGKITLVAKSGKNQVKKKITIKKDKIDHIEAAYKGQPAFQGNPIKKSDLQVKAVYKSGRKKVLSSYQLKQSSFSKVGKEKITVSYGSYSTKTTVLVSEKKVTSLQAVYRGGSLAVGQSIKVNDMSVTAVYNDGSTRILGADEIVLTNATAKEKGTLSVVITHIASGVQATVNIVVNGLSILGVDTNYSGGVIYKEEGVDTSKVKIVVTYEDGSTALVDASDIRVGSTISEDGKVKVLLYYTVDGVEYSTILSAEEKSHKLTDLIVESQRAYAFCGKELNRNNFLVKARYSDGSERIVEDWICDYKVLEEEGKQNVVFQYTEDAITVTDEMEIQIKQAVPKTLKVVKPITNLKEGENLDLSKMQVMAVYDDGCSEIVNGYTTDYDSNNKTPGVRTVTIEYEGLTTSMQVLIEAKKLLSISASNPIGITLAGNEMNMQGMAVTAYYDNQTSEVVGGWSTSYSKDLPAGTYAIAVQYKDASCHVQVVVENPMEIALSANSTIVKHSVTLTCNQGDVSYSVVGGSAILGKSSGNSMYITATAPGTIVIQAVRAKTGEVRQASFVAEAFRLSYVNTAGGNVAEGDRLQFTTNASAQFRYCMNCDDGNVYTGSSSSNSTSYGYTANKLGVLTVTALDPVSGIILEKSVTVRKALNISGNSSVLVGKTITLTTTKQVVNWSSSNSAVATVNKSGVVKGVKAGTVTITATFPEYGNRKITKKITVKKAS